MNRPRESSGQGSILTRLEEWAGFLLGRTKESMPGSENKVGYANSFFFFFFNHGKDSQFGWREAFKCQLTLR